MNEQSDRPAVLACKNLVKSFKEGGGKLEVLSGVNMTVDAGERVAVIGASGSGKTTLLQLLGGLDTPTSGSVEIDGRNLADIGNGERGRIRNESLGFVYQFHHLLPEFTALENVAMPLLLRRMPVSEVREAAASLLGRVGLAERLEHRPGELSGGERQRAAVARALVTKPAVVLADEPTGNLDRQTGEKVFRLMLELNQEYGSSLIVVTHDMEIAHKMDRVLQLDNGVLAELGNQS